MSANTTPLLANPDFNNIEASLKNYLRAQDRFKDYDFEGSNLSTLVNLLAYNTYQNAFVSNMVSSEMFLDTAQLRSSIVSRAKELGYTPRSQRSASAVVDIKVTPTGTPGSVVIPRGALFNSTVGSRSFTFITDRAYTVLPINGVYEAKNVEIFEGFPVTELFTPSGAERERYVISNARIDTRSLVVLVDGVEYKNASSILDLTSTSQVFFLQLNHQNKYELVFGANIVGIEPVQSQQIVIRYDVSSGSDANGARVFRSSGTLQGHTDIQVTTVSAASGGAPAETTESIRRNAPLVYQTRNRAVTRDDYKVLLRQEFPEIQAINVYGGETVTPQQYGRVFISVDVQNALGVSDTQKAAFYRYIKSKCPVTVEPVFVDPTFMFLRLRTRVYFDYVNFNASEDDIASAVVVATEQFNETELADFDRTFLYSQFVNVIDQAHPAVLSNDTQVDMVLALDTGVLSNAVQRLTFNNEIATENVQRAITSSPFIYRDKTCQLQDNGLGVIRVVTNTSSANPAQLLEVGAVDYKTGIVTINPFDVQQVFGYGIRLYAIPKDKNIKAVQNVLLNVDTSEVNITAIATKK